MERSGCQKKGGEQRRQTVKTKEKMRWEQGTGIGKQGVIIQVFAETGRINEKEVLNRAS